MRGHASHYALAVALLLNAACGSDATGLASVPISGFERHALDPNAPLPALSLTMPEKRMLSIAGALTTPCQHYWAAASDVRRNSTLTITVEAYPTTACAAGAPPGALGYRYLLFSLTPGHYELVIVHRYQSDAFPMDTAYRANVEIP